jgi:hypothetical protein
VWCVVCGVWCVVCGVWCVVCGVWCVCCLIVNVLPSLTQVYHRACADTDKPVADACFNLGVMTKQGKD